MHFRGGLELLQQQLVSRKKVAAGYSHYTACQQKVKAAAVGCGLK
jgi:hypothetical protein